MKVQFYCDNTLLSTFYGTREEVGARLKEATQNLALSIDEEFELQNRLTVLYQDHGYKDLVYQTDRFRFRLCVPDKMEERVA